MRPGRCAAAGAVAVLLLTGCTGVGADRGPDPAPQPTPDEPSWTVESLAEAILEGDPTGPGQPVVSQQGTVTTDTGQWSAEVSVLSVTAHDTGTDLTYLLRSVDGDLTAVDRFAWGAPNRPWRDTRAIAVIDDAADTRLFPYTGHASRVSEDVPMFCACSEMPMSVSDGTVLGAFFPRLTPGTETVTVEFPGFEPLADVPVTWVAP